MKNVESYLFVYFYEKIKKTILGDGKMSLTSWLNRKTEEHKEFASIIYDVTPLKADFKTLSGNKAFSKEYEMLVPYQLKQGQATIVGTAFDYLARFRIGNLLKDKSVTQDLVAERGFKKLLLSPIAQAKGFNKQFYVELLEPVVDYIDGEEKNIEGLIPIAYRLSKLENIARSGWEIETVNLNDLSNGLPTEEISNELKSLMRVYEEKFIIPEIINENSEIKLNPHFGVASLLVGGADADILIDGTLYDFKTTKVYGYRKVDAAQLMGYYILNQLAIELDSNLIGFPFEELKIDRVAFYKARYGEVEFFDLSNIASATKKDVMKKLAKFFIGKAARLGLANPFADIDQLEAKLIDYGRK